MNIIFIILLLCTSLIEIYVLVLFVKDSGINNFSNLPPLQRLIDPIIIGFAPINIGLKIYAAVKFLQKVTKASIYTAAGITGLHLYILVGEATRFKVYSDMYPSVYVILVVLVIALSQILIFRLWPMFNLNGEIKEEFKVDV